MATTGLEEVKIPSYHLFLQSFQISRNLVNCYDQLETTMALYIYSSRQLDRNFRNVDTLSLLLTFMALPGVTISNEFIRKLNPWPYGSKSSNVVHNLLHDVAITGRA